MCKHMHICIFCINFRTYAVFEMPPRDASSSGQENQKVAGKAIQFGPSGIQFALPVTLSLPLDLTGLDLGGLVLLPHR